MDKQSTPPLKPRSIQIDYDRYAHMFENSDATEEQKQEFFKTLANIIINFVDLGFGVHPLQQAINASDDISACEQIAIPLQYLTQDSSSMIKLDNAPKTDFKHAAHDENPSCVEEDES